MYEYAAKLIKVIDGDTLDLSVDLGVSIKVDMRIRLVGIDAYELKTEKGWDARTEVVNWFLRNNGVVLLKTIKDKKEKYGRYLGNIFLLEGGVSLNDHLISMGFAKPYTGGPR